MAVTEVANSSASAAGLFPSSPAHHPAHPLGKPRNALEQHLDRLALVGTGGTVEVGLDRRGDFVAKPLEGLVAADRAPRVKLHLVSRDPPQPGPEIVAPVKRGASCRTRR